MHGLRLTKEKAPESDVKSGQQVPKEINKATHKLLLTKEKASETEVTAEQWAPKVNSPKVTGKKRSYEDSVQWASKRQAERVKRDKAQVKRGDDVEPQIKPDMVPVARFHGSHLASGHAPSPYQHTQSSNQRAPKIARLSSEATIGAALVEAENNLEKEASENKEELKTKLKGILREKSDTFNCLIIIGPLYNFR